MIAVAMMEVSARADVPSYGSPLLDFDGGDFGHYVNASGVAAGSAVKGELGFLGSRAVKWDALGNAYELGNLGTDANGTAFDKVLGINSSGQVAGYAQKYVSGVSKGIRAVRWDNTSNTPIELGNLGTDTDGITSAYANAINANGITAGLADKYVSNAYVGSRPVRWDSAGNITELGHLGLDSSGSTTGNLFAINANNQAAGWLEKHNGATNLGTRAVRWDASGAAIELNHLGTDVDGSTRGYAQAINASGQTAGTIWRYDAGVYVGARAVRWAADGSAMELAQLGVDSSGNASAAAVAINDSRQTAGTSEKYVGEVDLGIRAVRWDTAGNATELATLGQTSSGLSRTEAYAMNASGQVAGLASKFVSGDFVGNRAVVWQSDGSALDLNTLISSTSGWTLNAAESITDNGWVAGGGLFIPSGGTIDNAVYRFFSININASNVWTGPSGTSSVNWNTGANWRDGVAPGVARDVAFNTAGLVNVDISNPVTARDIHITTGSVVFRQSGHSSTFKGALTIDSGASLTINSGVATVGSLRGDGGIVLTAGGVVEIAPNGGASGVSVIRSIAMTGSSHIDLHNNDMVIPYSGSASPYNSYRNLVKSGLFGSSTPLYGITSSEIRSGAAQGISLAVVDNGNASVNGAITSTSGYAGIPHDAIIIKYTWLGDANLDGKVDGTDYSLIDTGFASSGYTWSHGDFNYSGGVDGTDYALIDTGFSAQSGTLPEPAVLGIASIAMFVLGRRKRGISR